MALLITDQQIALAPKVLLHDHLDGGLRPQTMIDHALASGYTKLPSYEPEKLAKWFVDACSSGTLELYLETFEHTISVMQTPEEIIRVARECVIDLAADGVVYAEVRGAPELFTRKGLTLDQVIEATVEGFNQGMAEVAHNGKKIRVEHLLCALRQNHVSEEVATKVVKYKGRGVVAFNTPGPETGSHRQITSKHLTICAITVRITQSTQARLLESNPSHLQYANAAHSESVTVFVSSTILTSRAVKQSWAHWRKRFLIIKSALRWLLLQISKPVALPHMQHIKSV